MVMAIYSMRDQCAVANIAFASHVPDTIMYAEQKCRQLHLYQ